MKITFFLLWLFLFSSCYPDYSSHNSKYKTNPVAKKKAYEITANVSKTLCKRYHMKQTGFGAGMMGKIRELALTFRIVGPLPKDELRRIALDCVNEYQTAINNCKEIRVGLVEYPFPKSNIGITIIVDDKDGTDFLPHPHIGVVSFVKNSFYYDTNKSLTKYQTSVSEPYAEAIKIVQEEKKAAVADQKKLTEEELKKEEKHINTFFYEFTQNK